MIARRIRITIAVICLLLAIGAPAYADTTARGGIISNYTTNGNAGQISITVTNPFGTVFTGYVNWSVTGGYSNGNSGSSTYTLAPHGSTTITVSTGGYFDSSTSGAAGQDPTGTNTATGYGTSSTDTNTCDGRCLPQN